MENLKEKLLEQFNSLVDDLLINLNLAGKSEQEVQGIRHFLEEALSDRVNLFILENLSSEGLKKYEELISVDNPNFTEIETLIISDIKDFQDLLQKDLSEFSQEAISNFSK
jgi:hypothetical protein